MESMELIQRLITLCILSAVLLPDLASSTTFSFTTFSPNDRSITVSNDTTISEGSLRLTSSQFGSSNVFNGTGRAQYSEPIQLWDLSTNATTNFTTYFEFIILFTNGDYNTSSGGFAFFLAPEDSVVPKNSAGGYLGLFNETIDGDPSNHLLAVEFDTYKNQWDASNNHVGINVNSIVSKVNNTWSNTMTSGDTLAARISYVEASKTLSVHLKDPQVPVDTGSLNITYEVDLKKILPEKVVVGFSASTGNALIVQKITMWNFTSSLEIMKEEGNNNGGFKLPGNNNGGFKLWQLGLSIAIGVLLLLFFSLCYMYYKRENKDEELEEIDLEDESMHDYFARGTGPRRFTYRELVSATNNFSDEGKLGEGGFGEVYKGFLESIKTQVAVKKISKGSKQGRKEYVSEVTIISKLRHRNLVQLMGWSHGGGEFLLVYEFMPNGSLDSHLFSPTRNLPWKARYKIAVGLASALLYLHEEWEQCVVHRDIKSSNVMLDSEFNARLGDFGLARVGDHKLGLQTTAVAGTWGYMAPECFITHKASKESDVFSFGVVALEIACGRRAVEHGRKEDEVALVEWVWGLNGEGRVLEGVDKRLAMEFKVEEMERLMLVGLWCAHPDHERRPSMREVMLALGFQGVVPELPKRRPVPVFANYAAGFAPSLDSSHSNPPSITYTSLVAGR
ncbi:hypothetical protein J5N97_019872 [Dioscorea zingiberensis]|uniref:non-specific serine/threonine protein kinase n=1 Tax=Dioscorea zingiberensis TaxID=325984 RepID=A0A9D5HDA1_9LILI|nr:hypothetical protein J5N97_019872 [Dioscorea zingiberensis]